MKEMQLNDLEILQSMAYLRNAYENHDEFEFEPPRERSKMERNDSDNPGGKASMKGSWLQKNC